MIEVMLWIAVCLVCADLVGYLAVSLFVGTRGAERNEAPPPKPPRPKPHSRLGRIGEHEARTRYRGPPGNGAVN